MITFRLYGPRCGGCLETVSPRDLVRKAREKVYHVKCFICQMCRYGTVRYSTVWYSTVQYSTVQ